MIVKSFFNIELSVFTDKDKSKKKLLNANLWVDIEKQMHLLKIFILNFILMPMDLLSRHSIFVLDLLVLPSRIHM